MKVLHISYASTWGGGEQQMVNLLEGVTGLGVENLLICINNSALENYSLANNINFIGIDRKKGFNIRYLKGINSIIRNYSPDILHIHTGSFLKDFLIISKLQGVKCKVVFTMNGMIRKKNLLSKIKYNNTEIDRYYCISKSVEDNFKKNVLYQKNHNKTGVVYDGINLEKGSDAKSPNIDLRKQLSLKSDIRIVGNIANHTDAKDLLSFFSTANYLINIEKNKNLVFVQIGRESKRTRDYKNFIDANGLSDRVHILGFMENAREYLEFFDCFLMTSNREGLSMSILESFLYKTPVVSTRAGGVPEVVIHEETGLLADIGDHESLGKQVKRIFLEKGLKEKLTLQAHKKLLSNFTKETLAKSTFDFYKKLMYT
ncbi:glycosyltransferase family 4 protein [Aquimarina sp. 2-A2]|uniref:glycosyltransferase family 4 protein n=1 Tax=Aquimarina sp. 2-A2 TaxID=3382644 RepID=UPI00387EFAA0